VAGVLLKICEAKGNTRQKGGRLELLNIVKEIHKGMAWPKARHGGRSFIKKIHSQSKHITKPVLLNIVTQIHKRMAKGKGQRPKFY
jgi:hypothetical protein